jgi:hypothetical protein
MSAHRVFDNVRSASTASRWLSIPYGDQNVTLVDYVAPSGLVGGFCIREHPIQFRYADSAAKDCPKDWRRIFVRESPLIVCASERQRDFEAITEAERNFGKNPVSAFRQS